MPKIIENVREQLLAEARRQIAERGYGSTTIRSVAGECGLAVGTVYNYFRSKEMLVAGFMAEDWQACLSELHAMPDDATPERRLFAVYSTLTRFIEQYKNLFADREAEKSFALTSSAWHPRLREQLAAFILPLCHGEDPVFCASFVAEALVCWRVAGKTFAELSPLLLKLIKK